MNRRKLLVIRGRLKLGRCTYFEDRSSRGASSPSTSSRGITCCINLRRRRLARHNLKATTADFRIGIAHLLKRRSWRELPDSWCLPASCSFSLSLEPDRFCFSLERLLSACSLSDDAVEGTFSPGMTRTGRGSSRLTIASGVCSFMLRRPSSCGGLKYLFDAQG